MAYTQEDIRRGRELASSPWELGDLACKVAPTADGPENTGAYVIIRDFAAEIGAEFETLRRYRIVASAWPHVARSTCATWTAHKALTAEPDKVQILAALIEKHGWVTAEIVHRFRSGASSKPKPIERVLDGLDSYRKATARLRAIGDPNFRLGRYGPVLEEHATRLHGVADLIERVAAGEQVEAEELDGLLDTRPAHLVG